MDGKNQTEAKEVKRRKLRSKLLLHEIIFALGQDLN